ncbi:MAG: 23S ribosomal RNA methyltransferase Erm [Chloroflexia bacterium]|nr:23S ribosomal RNA methyltransferase Erm [Chloroflexia bacterium]
MPSIKERRIRFSQNFLHDRRLVARLVARSSLESHDVVVEIGPGRGIITEALAQRCAHVLAVEQDPHQVGVLRERFGAGGKVTVFPANFLEFPLPATDYKVFANIPYRITTAIVSKLTSGVSPPADSYLVMQREAADKFAGVSKETLVAVVLKPRFDLDIVHRFQRSDFVPAPNVESVLLRLRRRGVPLLPQEHEQRFRDLVTAVFGAWQPSVDAALTGLMPHAALVGLRRRHGELLHRRPSQTPFGDWLALFDALLAQDDQRIWKRIQGAENRLVHQQSQLTKQHRTRVARSK